MSKSKTTARPNQSPAHKEATSSRPLARCTSYVREQRTRPRTARLAAIPTNHIPSRRVERCTACTACTACTTYITDWFTQDSVTSARNAFLAKHQHQHRHRRPNQSCAAHLARRMQPAENSISHQPLAISHQHQQICIATLCKLLRTSLKPAIVLFACSIHPSNQPGVPSPSLLPRFFPSTHPLIPQSGKSTSHPACPVACALGSQLHVDVTLIIFFVRSTYLPIYPSTQPMYASAALGTPTSSWNGMRQTSAANTWG